MVKRKPIPDILAAFWSKKEAEVGEKVALEAITKNAEGLNATFQIYEYRKKNQIIEEIKVPVKGSKIAASWKVRFIPDIYGKEPPEYRFKVTIGKTSKKSKTLYLKAEMVTIALTFDDGPHAADLGIKENKTEKVLNILRKKEIKAAFFIQTHAPGRAKTANGGNVVQRMAEEGHIVGIHTGSLKDHVEHALRVKDKPEDVNGDGKLDGENGLESDLIRAKFLIKKLTGKTPEFVRAPYGRYKAHREILPTYRRQKLIHVSWDVDSLDNTPLKGRRRSPEEVKKALKDSFAASKFNEVIVLFHDLNLYTSEKLEDYINIIIKATVESKKAPRFTSRTQELQVLLRRKGVK